jgi:hypothetical protein
MEKRPVFFAKQVWQLRDIRRDPPRLVFAEQLGSRSPAGLLNSATYE